MNRQTDQAIKEIFGLHTTLNLELAAALNILFGVDDVDWDAVLEAFRRHGNVLANQLPGIYYSAGASAAAQLGFNTNLDPTTDRSVARANAIRNDFADAFTNTAASVLPGLQLIQVNESAKFFRERATRLSLLTPLGFQANRSYEESLRRPSRRTPLKEDRITRQVVSHARGQLNRRTNFTATSVGTRVANEAVVDLFDQSIVEGIIDPNEYQQVWVTRDDGNVRDSHSPLNGVPISPEGNWRTGLGSLVRYPGDPGAPAQDTANCRCSIEIKRVGNA